MDEGGSSVKVECSRCHKIFDFHEAVCISGKMLCGTEKSYQILCRKCYGEYYEWVHTPPKEEKEEEFPRTWSIGGGWLRGI